MESHGYSNILILSLFYYFSPTRGDSTLARVVKNVIVDLHQKVSNVIWKQENASVNQPLLEDVVIGANLVTTVTLLMVVKVRTVHLLFGRRIYVFLVCLHSVIFACWVLA